MSDSFLPDYREKCETADAFVFGSPVHYAAMSGNMKGFTLVELLAVIVILGVLTTITTVSVTDTINKSKNKLTDIQINAIE